MVIISCIYLSLRLSNNVKSPPFCVKIIALDLSMPRAMRAGEVFDKKSKITSSRLAPSFF